MTKRRKRTTRGARRTAKILKAVDVAYSVTKEVLAIAFLATGILFFLYAAGLANLLTQFTLNALGL